MDNYGCNFLNCYLLRTPCFAFLCPWLAVPKLTVPCLWVPEGRTDVKIVSGGGRRKWKENEDHAPLYKVSNHSICINSVSEKRNWRVGREGDSKEND
jgi:hypothetical protein